MHVSIIIMCKFLEIWNISMVCNSIAICRSIHYHVHRYKHDALEHYMYINVHV